MNLFLIFLTGLTTGGLSCLALQGGLLASVIANQKEQEHQNNISDNIQNKSNNTSYNTHDLLPVVMFLGAKLTIHTILGFFLGLLGSVISLSLGVRLIFQILTALFMFATAMNLLNVHPIFRYIVFQPPKFLQRIIRNSIKSKALFAPSILGLMTIFIPCGITQAMEVLAINSGSPITGALIMFFFILGTSPLFAILGFATAKLSEGWYKKFTKFASFALIIMALYNINGVLLVINSPISLNKIFSPINNIFSKKETSNNTDAVIKDNVQQVTIHILNNGYNPNYIKVKKDIPVELTLKSNGVYSCALSFIFQEYGIRVTLQSTDSRTFKFTPVNTGKYQFSCSMGMYRGILEVVK
ncbi:MAG TPA: sulfite exporter TauE/SafE family protein [Patescibacteria group bacterium]|nr:sulfite exporter TauE/SafE family protein [Patescibacteria group bacterium]